ncbi:MAG: endo-1,4-beta-xylanase [Candidatus Limnocylindrales bacterium]
MRHAVDDRADSRPANGTPLARPLSRRRLLQGGVALGAGLLAASCGSSTPTRSPQGSALARATTAAASVPPSTPPAPVLTASLLRTALGDLPSGGTVALPGDTSAPYADLAAVAAAFATAESANPDPVTDPIASLGFALACADWSGRTGLIDLSTTLPKLGIPIVRLELPKLPGSDLTDTLAQAAPPELVLRPGAALLPAAVLPDGRLVLGVVDPARQVAAHPRLELALVAPATAAPLLEAAGATLDASGAIALAGESPVTLASVDPALTSRLATAAGVLFVDLVPLQPPQAAKPVLTADPVVPVPDASVVSRAIRVSPAKDGRILALDASGKAVGRAEYIGGTPAWDWLGAGEIAWTLREEADAIDWRVGCEITGYAFSDQAWRSIMRAQFNQVTVDWGIYWGEIEPAPGQFTFSTAQRQIAWAVPNNVRVRGHALVFPSEMPDWVTSSRLSAARAQSLLQRHIATVVTEFKGAVAEWVVVNEPYLPPYRPNDPFYSALGYEYIDLAFAVARKADPSAVLVYSDTFNHTADGITTPLTRSNVRRLRAKGLVDAVGLEMHLDGANPPAEADVLATMRSYGVPVCVTEFDIDLTNVPGTTAERYAVQAQIATSMVRAARDSGVCRNFTVWGIGDAYEAFFAGSPTRAEATPFDAELRPKPFYNALLAGLS